MSQVSFFDFENLTDNDRQIVEIILSTRVDPTKAVEFPWEEENYNLEEFNLAESTPVVNNHQIHFLHTPSSSSQCVVDMNAVCIAGPAYYTQPVYVLTPVAPAASLIYPGPGMTSASMIASPVPVLTTAGYNYMTSLPAHMVHQQMMLAPTHAGGLMLSGMIEQAPPCGIVMPAPMLPPPAAGYMHGPMPTAGSKPLNVVDGLPLSGFVDHSAFGHVHSSSEATMKMQYSFQPVDNGNVPFVADVGGQSAVIHNYSANPSVSQSDNIVSHDEPSEFSFQFMNGGVEQPEAARTSDDAVLSHGESELSVETSADSIITSHSQSTIVSPAEDPHDSASDHMPNTSADELDVPLQLKLDISDDAVLNVREASQWPAIGELSPPVCSAGAAAAKSKVTKWSSFFKDTPTAANAVVINSSSRQPSSNHKSVDAKMAHTKDAVERVPVKNMSCNEVEKHKIAELLKLHKPSHRSAQIQPRGLTNRGNWCYVNATLQALLACPPFYHLIKLLPPLHNMFTDDKSVAVMRSMVEFVSNFSEKPIKSFEKQSENAKGNIRQEIKCGSPFEPVQVYKMLQAIDYQAFKHGQQEDAEEFLSCILNRLHDEMVAITKLIDTDNKQVTVNGGDIDSTRHSAIANNVDAESEMSTSDDKESRWEQVRSRNRTVFNSAGDNESSPISAIFRGQICSILHQLGQKESATLQSFFTLQLDVQNENVKSVKDALEQLVSKESLQGYTCTKSKVEVDATQRMLLEELPPVLVLQLKWFIYDKNGGLQKYVKQVDFDIDLEISKDLLSAHAKSKCSASHRKYKLFAVVNHIGARAIGGHYTVDVFHAGYNCWLHCDDNNVTSMPTNSVTKFTSPKVPYLIFYRRLEPS